MKMKVKKEETILLPPHHCISLTSLKAELLPKNQPFCIVTIGAMDIHLAQQLAIQDIQILSLDNLYKLQDSNATILFWIDFSAVENKPQDKMRKLIRGIQHCYRKNIPIGIQKEDTVLIGYGENYHNTKPGSQDIIHTLTAMLHTDLLQRQAYLYHAICTYLDQQCITKNICEFKDNKCVVKRNTSSNVGCCHHYKNRYFGILYQSKMIECEYQKDKTCQAHCIACKLYTCDYLRKKGHIYRLKDIPLVTCFFNRPQQLYMKTCFFTDQDTILKWLYRLRSI